ncbi:hypothetical protein P3T76_009691 [Phytophthora citrophthora]|uniref:DUF4219 domain-containing protein n=1 Tax=Phytophthora citrophthora TaxID=4793 RepID=A0AAD9GGD2_9STRA|nr:hypothetical protein P3T76_009691 [Phytophthora citrophthora]
MSPSPVFPAEDSDYAFAMDTTSTTTSRINKFDGTNFHTWKFKMRMVLEERDLWEVTCGEIEEGRSRGCLARGGLPKLGARWPRRGKSLEG